MAAAKWINPHPYPLEVALPPFPNVYADARTSNDDGMCIQSATDERVSEIENDGKTGEFVIFNSTRNVADGDEVEQCFTLEAKSDKDEMETFIIIAKDMNDDGVPGVTFEPSTDFVPVETNPVFPNLSKLVAYYQKRIEGPLASHGIKLELHADDEDSDEEDVGDDDQDLSDFEEDDVGLFSNPIASKDRARSPSVAGGNSFSDLDGIAAESAGYEVVKHFVVDSAFQKSHKARSISNETEVRAQGKVAKDGKAINLLTNDDAHQGDTLLWSDFRHDLKWPELDQLGGKPKIVSLQWLTSKSTAASNGNDNDLLAVVVEVFDESEDEEVRERHFRVAVYQPKTGELSYIISRQFKGKHPAKPEVRWITSREMEDLPTLLFFNNDPQPAPRFFDIASIHRTKDGTITGERRSAEMSSDGKGKKVVRTNEIHITRSRAALGDFGLSLGKHAVMLAGNSNGVGEPEEIELEKAIVSRPSEAAAQKEVKTAGDPNAQLWAPAVDVPVVLVNDAKHGVPKDTAVLVRPTDADVKEFRAMFNKKAWPTKGAGDILKMKNSDGHDVALGESKLYCGIAKQKIPAEYSCISAAGLNYYNAADFKAVNVVTMIAGEWTIDYRSSPHMQAVSYFDEEKYIWNHSPGADTFSGECEEKGVNLAGGGGGGGSGEELLVKSTKSSHESGNSYYGIFFDVTAKDNAVELLNVLAGSEGKGDSTGTLYYRQGSYEGNQTSSAGWEIACKAVELTKGRPSTTPLDAPIEVKAGETVGFYCHGPSHNESVAYVKDGSGTYTWVGDTNALAMTIGNYQKSATPFTNVDSEKRQFAGGIGFKIVSAQVADGAAEGPPTLSEMPGRIRNVVLAGAPLWNAGRHAECTQMYEDVAKRYAELEPLLDKALKDCKGKPDDVTATSKGWTLRRTFDLLLDNRVVLGAKSPVVKGTVKEDGSKLLVEWTCDHSYLEGFDLKTSFTAANGEYQKCRLKDPYAQRETAGADTYQNSKAKQFVMLRWSTEVVVVRGLIEGGQAARLAGVKADDIITNINGNPVRGVTQPNVVKMIGQFKVANLPITFADRKTGKEVTVKFNNTAGQQLGLTLGRGDKVVQWGVVDMGKDQKSFPGPVRPANTYRCIHSSGIAWRKTAMIDNRVDDARGPEHLEEIEASGDPIEANGLKWLKVEGPPGESPYKYGEKPGILYLPLNPAKVKQEKMFVLSGAGTERFNGLYKKTVVPRYSGVPPYCKVGAENLIMIRWSRKNWILLDMGAERKEFPKPLDGEPGENEYYKVPSSAELPPFTGWVASRSGDSPLPTLREASLEDAAKHAAEDPIVAKWVRGVPNAFELVHVGVPIYKIECKKDQNSPPVVKGGWKAVPDGPAASSGNATVNSVIKGDVIKCEGRISSDGNRIVDGSFYAMKGGVKGMQGKPLGTFTGMRMKKKEGSETKTDVAMGQLVNPQGVPKTVKGVKWIQVTVPDKAWKQVWDKCIKVNDEGDAEKYHEEDGDFHSAMTDSISTANGAVHTIKFTLAKMRNSNVGLSTGDLDLKVSPSSFRTRFSLVYWQSGNSFITCNNKESESKEIKSLSTDDVVTFVVDTTVKGKVGCKVLLNNVLQREFKNLHDLGLPADEDIHAYANLDYPGEKIGVSIDSAGGRADAAGAKDMLKWLPLRKQDRPVLEPAKETCGPIDGDQCESCAKFQAEIEGFGAGLQFASDAFHSDATLRDNAKSIARVIQSEATDFSGLNHNQLRPGDELLELFGTELGIYDVALKGSAKWVNAGELQTADSFEFDPDKKSPKLTLSEDNMKIVKVKDSDNNTIRMLPAVSSGQQAVSFKIVRGGGTGNLGACYFVGVCSPEFDSWTSKLDNRSSGWGMEDDNSGPWKMPVSNNGRAYKSGDIVTMVADFGANTITIYRNAGSENEGVFVHEGIPCPTIHFAITIYNTDAVVEFVDHPDSLDLKGSVQVEEGTTVFYRDPDDQNVYALGQEVAPKLQGWIKKSKGAITARLESARKPRAVKVPRSLAGQLELDSSAPDDQGKKMYRITKPTQEMKALGLVDGDRLVSAGGANCDDEDAATVARLIQPALDDDGMAFKFDSTCNARYLKLEKKSMLATVTGDEPVVRILPAFTEGHHTVSFRVKRRGRADGDSMGSGYYVGIINEDYSPGTSSLHNGNSALGIESDNDSSRWKSFSSKSKSGNAFDSGDVLTFDVNYTTDTITIYRNKGILTNPGKISVSPIPFKGKKLYVAIRLYNDGASAELLGSGATGGFHPSFEGRHFSRTVLTANSIVYMPEPPKPRTISGHWTMNDAGRAAQFHYEWTQVPGSIYFTGNQVDGPGSSKVVYKGVRGRIYPGNKIEWRIANVVCTATMNQGLNLLTAGAYHEEAGGKKVKEIGKFLGIKTDVFKVGASLEYRLPNHGEPKWVSCSITSVGSDSLKAAAPITAAVGPDGQDTSAFTDSDDGCTCWLKPGESDGPISTQGESYTLKRFDSPGSVMVSSSSHDGWWMSSAKLQRWNPLAEVAPSSSSSGGASKASKIPMKKGRDGVRFYCGRQVGNGSYRHGPMRWCAAKYGKPEDTTTCSCDGQCGPGNGCQCSDCYEATYGTDPSLFHTFNLEYTDENGGLVPMARASVADLRLPGSEQLSLDQMLDLDGDGKISDSEFIAAGDAAFKGNGKGKASAGGGASTGFSDDEEDGSGSGGGGGGGAAGASGSTSDFVLGTGNFICPICQKLNPSIKKFFPCHSRK